MPISGRFAEDEYLGRPHSYWRTYRDRIRRVTFRLAGRRLGTVAAAGRSGGSGPPSLQAADVAAATRARSVNR